MLTALKQKLKQIIKPSSNVSQAEKKQAIFYDDPVLGVKRRQYASYEEYLHHQAEKLGKVGESIVQGDREYEELLVSRYASLSDWHGKSILCLGARLGGEVRAFKTLGALAIGIDIEPGEKNYHVLHGDFHNLLFPDECFDFAFTNVIDHVFDLDQFLKETSRILKHNGIFWVEFGEVPIGLYEVIDTTSPDTILARFEQEFELINQEPIQNTTGYINWAGKLLAYRKTDKQ